MFYSVLETPNDLKNISHTTFLLKIKCPGATNRNIKRSSEPYPEIYLSQFFELKNLYMSKVVCFDVIETLFSNVLV